MYFNDSFLICLKSLFSLDMYQIQCGLVGQINQVRI